MIADALSYMSAVEKIGWLAETIPQEGGRLFDPTKNNSLNRDLSVAELPRLEDAEGGNGKALAKGKGLTESWPKSGVISFENVWMVREPVSLAFRQPF
jgi:hypothetical protein